MANKIIKMLHDLFIVDGGLSLGHTLVNHAHKEIHRTPCKERHVEFHERFHEKRKEHCTVQPHTNTLSFMRSFTRNEKNTAQCNHTQTHWVSREVSRETKRTLHSATTHKHIEFHERFHEKRKEHCTVQPHTNNPSTITGSPWVFWGVSI